MTTEVKAMKEKDRPEAPSGAGISGQEPGKAALVVGSQGVIGRNLIDHLSTLGDWEVIGLSRRGGEDRERVRHIAVDLLDAADIRRQLRGVTGVTHIFYAAYQDRASWSELVAPNLAMLVNVVEAVEMVAPGLRHISLMQGYKVYGAHLGPFRTPAKESDAGRHLILQGGDFNREGELAPSLEFNLEQQYFLERRQLDKRWSWSAIRPSVVGGFALGNPMNLAMVIAVYASIAKELGEPLHFPGKAGAYHPLLEMTDAGLLAKATVWAATDPRAANQAFNINNGDLFRWEDLWPVFGEYFGMEAGAPKQVSLSEIMPGRAPVWEEMSRKYGLKHSYAEVSSWGFGDFVFSWDYDFFADGSKARRLGFHEYVDTEGMFRGLFDEFRRRKVIP